MIKKKQMYTKLEFEYKQDDETSDALLVTFETKDGNETVQIAAQGQQCPPLPFEMLSEIVSTIQRWKTASGVVRTPVVKDLREENNDTLSDAGKIQLQVDSAMERIGDTTDQNISLLKPEGNTPVSTDVEDPVGISVEDLARLGPVPETPPEFKHQLQNISKERTGFKPTLDESKKIKSKDR